MWFHLYPTPTCLELKGLVVVVAVVVVVVVVVVIILPGTLRKRELRAPGCPLM
jgi:hypothetical protein